MKNWRIYLTSDIEESANTMVEKYLHGDEIISEIRDKVYAVGRTIAKKSEIVEKENNSRKKTRARIETAERVEGRDEKT